MFHTVTKTSFQHSQKFVFQGRNFVATSLIVTSSMLVLRDTELNHVNCVKVKALTLINLGYVKL
jgi:hypothetical protein